MFDRCRVWRSLMTRRAECVLSPTERAMLHDHITNCAPCRKVEDADEALRSITYLRDAGLPAGEGPAFDNRVITDLRSFQPSTEGMAGWRQRVRACAAGLSFEFCMQLAGGGLAAASITGYVLISALNPAVNPKGPSAYEVRTITAAERNEPPVSLESLFQVSAPRAAMLWAAPGRSLRRHDDDRSILTHHKPALRGKRSSERSRRHGEREPHAAMG